MERKERVWLEKEFNFYQLFQSEREQKILMKSKNKPTVMKCSGLVMAMGSFF